MEQQQPELRAPVPPNPWECCGRLSSYLFSYFSLESIAVVIHVSMIFTRENFTHTTCWLNRRKNWNRKKRRKRRRYSNKDSSIVMKAKERTGLHRIHLIFESEEDSEKNIGYRQTFFISFFIFSLKNLSAKAMQLDMKKILIQSNIQLLHLVGR